MGRFAPSPTGHLHFGSLVAALASWLQARQAGGRWLLRMEDLDPPREIPGAADDILRTLEVYGLHWDGAVVYQSQRNELYQAALDRLLDAGLAYRCGCSRKEVRALGRFGIDGIVYPGTCRSGLPAGKSPRAYRLRVEPGEIHFSDAIQGTIIQNVAQDIGDFVLKRADGFWAYQLAVVVDDAEQGVTEVVRGADLLDSTGRQIHLQRSMGMPTPGYAHLPIALNELGQKLSKQTHAPALARNRILPTLRIAWRFLGQEGVPGDLLATEDFLAWAATHWDIGRVVGSSATETDIHA
ncbi:MAG: tRNA glutamyl-Q(34) synthetase GluQRS [Chromatiales bacterium]|nr:tRNA glutamyl-Q(34) synthetase GluQRS [Chromatiales bacterium]